MAHAASLVTRVSHARGAARGVEELVRRVKGASGALVFLSGQVADSIEQVAACLSRANLEVPILLGVGTGVLNERLEVEGESAVAALAWTDRASSWVTTGASALDLLSDRRDADCRSVFLLLQAASFDPDTLRELRLPSKNLRVFGGGTAGSQAIFSVDTSGNVNQGRAGALHFASPLAPLITTTRGCQLITPLSPITHAVGSVLHRINGEPALLLLSRAGEALADQPLIFVALAHRTAVEQAEGRVDELLLRPIQGVDPSQHSIVVPEQLSEDYYAGFAVLDARAARADLEAALRNLGQATRGGQLRFGIYVNCAARGTHLYGAPQVDSRILRTRLGDVPLVGLSSAFEIAPFQNQPNYQMYTGVLSVFTAPS